MAERILRSPGATTRELDLSAPGQVTPQGVPAGIIGTAQKGPAFVPINFATATEFSNIFGATEGKHFGAMAVNEWMRNSRSGLFLRVLGVGDGKKRNAGTSVVTNAGFVSSENMMSPGAQSSAESDGSAWIPAVNPYAGAAVTSSVQQPVTVDQANIESVAAEAGQQEVFTLTIADNGAGYDGLYVVYEDIHDANTQYIWWVDGQHSSLNRTTDGSNVTDGAFTVFNKTTAGYPTATVSLLDGEGVTTGAALMALIEVKLNALYDVTGDWTGPGVIPHTVSTNEVVFNWSLATTTAANDPGAAYLNGPGTLSADVAAASHVIVKDSTDAITSDVTYSAITNAVAAAANTPDGTGLELKIEFATGVPIPVGSIFVLTGADGLAKLGVEITDGTGLSTAYTDANTASALNGVAAADVAAWIEFNGSAAADQDAIATGVAAAFTSAYTALQTQDTNDGAITDRQDAFNPTAASGAASLTAASVAYSNPTLAHVTLVFSKGTGTGESSPSLAITEASPSAPAGAVYFLSSLMETPDNTQDYLGVNTSGSKEILRGVVMFASGVVPGLETNGGNQSADVPTAAFGSYGTGLDAGDAQGVVSGGIFKMVLNGFDNRSSYDAHLTGSFDPLSPIYFPRVLNTDPTKLQETGHYLYAQYDVPAGLATPKNDNTGARITKGAHQSIGIAESNHFSSGSDYQPTYEDWRDRFSHAFTPWIKSQELGNVTKKLFRFHMLDAGQGGHNLVKVSVTNIQKSTSSSSDYGMFDIVVRSANDTDLDPVVLQTFSGLNLNPSSDRYIARVIGDENTFFEFDKNLGKQKLVTEGLYPNRSQYMRVEVMPEIETGGMEPTAIPFGFAGKHHLVLDGAALSSGTAMKEPPMPFRTTVSVGAGSKKVVDSRFYWGVQYQDIRDHATRNSSTGLISLVSNLTKWYPQIGAFPAWAGDNRGVVDSVSSASLDADTYENNEFSLGKIWVKCKSGSVANAVDPTMWHEAVYVRDGNLNIGGVTASNAESATAFIDTASVDKTNANGWRYLDVTKDFSSSASRKYYKFTVPFQGGWDGVDIFHKDKAEMNDLSSFREMDTTGSPYWGGENGATTASFRKALDILAEKSDVDIQLLACPGMRSAGVVDYAIDKTEDRFDALYLVDTIAYDHNGNRVTTSAQEISVTNSAQELANRNLDTSFAAAYFPDLVIQDGDNNLVAPPSVAVLGALSLNDAVAHPWFAPAGFARGALATTLETAVKLNRSNMDVLYDADINPITSFPQTGDSVIVFGQKTLLQAQSALDRVNVRRLLIDVRRKVREVANQVLFEPNRESTLARFSSLVNPILGRIQQQQGLDRYKVVIDTTTTTQQDVENNTIRGKIFLQPTRSIEFISLDFVVTNAGAEI